MLKDDRLRARIAAEAVALVVLVGGVGVWSFAVAGSEACDRRPPSDVLGELPQQAEVLKNESIHRDCDRYITMTASDGDLARLESDLVGEMTRVGWDLQEELEGWCGTLRDESDAFGVSLHQRDAVDSTGLNRGSAEPHLDVVVYNDSSDLGPCASQE